MIKIENVQTFGWEPAVRGMRNPMNSWERSDSLFADGPQMPTYDIQGICRYYRTPEPIASICCRNDDAYIGPNDLALMQKLVKAGPDHRKFMRMITVYADMTAPLYYWKEMDVYKVGTVCNSCSTMHKIGANEFTLDDFSHEHLGVTVPAELNGGDEVFQNLWIAMMADVVAALNVARDYFIREKDPGLKEQYWWQMIQLLPSSYNQRRTIMLNYEVLRNIYHARKNHKLDEWRDFCEWIKTLPYAVLITGEE